MGVVSSVLIVEDVADLRQLLNDVLTDAGYAVDARARPEEALAVLRERGPDSVALVLSTGRWANVRQSSPTTWQCLTHSVDPTGQVQERLMAAGPVEHSLTRITSRIHIEDRGHRGPWASSVALNMDLTRI